MHEILDVISMLHTIDIAFPLVDGNDILASDAAWSQMMLHIAEHITNQALYCALSDHMTSSKI